MNKGKILIYEDNQNKTKVEVNFINENIWLNVYQLADIFNVDRSGILKHILNIYTENELDKNSTCAKIAQVQKEGNREVKREIEYYNLDMIISVGYRVNSKRAVKFRIWATNKIKEFLIKGFVLDDDRLKIGKNSYFDELLERVRDIRTSERNFYQKITDIYTTSIDYDKNDKKTRDFFATVQNKLHYFIHKHTAAELIHKRIDSKKLNLGLLSFNGTKIKYSDIIVAKNYLNEKELKSLNLIIDSYLSFAEFQAQREQEMKMNDWILKLNDFIKLSGGEILENAGKISKDIANEKARKEFDKFKFKKDNDYLNDFDLEVKKIFKK